MVASDAPGIVAEMRAVSIVAKLRRVVRESNPISVALDFAPLFLVSVSPKDFEDKLRSAVV
jgi:hypothetical protein